MAGDSEYQGGAVVLNNFYNQLRQDEYRRQQQDAQTQIAQTKRRDATAKSLEGLTAKLNFKGIRGIDTPVLVNKFNEIKELKALANATDDSVKRAEYMNGMQEAVVDFELKANSSIEEKDKQAKFNEEVKKSPWLRSQSQLDNFDKRINTSTFSLNRWDENDWNAQTNPSAGLDKLRDRVSGVLKAQEESIQSINKTRGNRTGTEDYVIKQISKETATKEILKGLREDSEIGYSMKQSYPNLDDVSLANVLYEQFSQEGRYKTKDYKGFTANERELKDPDVANYANSTPVRKTFRSDSGKAAITSDRFIAENLGKLVLPQIEKVLNITNGKNEKLESLNDATVTGIGYFPANSTGVKDGTQKPIKGITVTRINKIKGIDIAEEIFLRESQIPAKFKQSKAYKALSAKLDTGQNNNTTPAKPKATSVKKGELD